MAYPIWTDNRNGNALTYVSPVNLGPAPNQPFVVYDSYNLTSIQNNNGQNLNYGDSLYMTLGLKNVGDQPTTNVMAYLSTDSPYVTITDSTEQYGDFSVGEVKSIPNGYSFKVSDTVPNGATVKFYVRAVNPDSSWFSHFLVKAHAPALHITNVVIHDSVNGNNNGRLDPGESDDVAVTLVNTGDFACKSTWVKISSPSDFLTFTVDSVYVDSISQNGNKIAIFKVDVAPDACLYTSADFHLAAGSGKYRAAKTQHETIGIIMEDWESGGFTKFPWTSGGFAPWFIDTIHYQGKYSARSGVIYDNCTSWLRVVMTAGTNDSISFYCKVSSEEGYDWLHFFIDSVPVGQWSGEQGWQRVAFPITAGTHTYKWWYVTDISILSGSNCGWVDNIVFPAPPLPVIFAGNDTVLCIGKVLQLHATVNSYDFLIWTTSGDGTFSNDTILNPVYTPGTNDISSGSFSLRLRATGANGCNEGGLHVTIGAPPAPQFTVLPKDTICGGQVIHVYSDSIAGWHYLWTPGGSTRPEVTIDTSMTGGFGSSWVRLRVTNAFECSSLDSVRITFKDCTGIDEHTTYSYELFPNPNNGTFTVKIRNNSNGQVTLRLQNMLSLPVFGDKDIKTSGTFVKTYNLNNLPAGIYILRIEDSERTVNVKMVVR